LKEINLNINTTWSNYWTYLIKIITQINCNINSNDINWSKKWHQLDKNRYAYWTKCWHKLIKMII
jgi:hypothetical protein